MLTMAETVWAIHNFEAEAEDEISFHIGEPITVLHRDELYQDGWWEVRWNQRATPHIYTILPATPFWKSGHREENNLIPSGAGSQKDCNTAMGGCLYLRRYMHGGICVFDRTRDNACALLQQKVFCLGVT